MNPKKEELTPFGVLLLRVLPTLAILIAFCACGYFFILPNASGLLCQFGLPTLPPQSISTLPPIGPAATSTPARAAATATPAIAGTPAGRASPTPARPGTPSGATPAAPT